MDEMPKPENYTKNGWYGTVVDCQKLGEAYLRWWYDHKPAPTESVQPGETPRIEKCKLCAGEPAIPYAYGLGASCLKKAVGAFLYEQPITPAAASPSSAPAETQKCNHDPYDLCNICTPELAEGYDFDAASATPERKERHGERRMQDIPFTDEHEDPRCRRGHRHFPKSLAELRELAEKAKSGDMIDRADAAEGRVKELEHEVGEREAFADGVQDKLDAAESRLADLLATNRERDIYRFHVERLWDFLVEKFGAKPDVTFADGPCEYAMKLLSAERERVIAECIKVAESKIDMTGGSTGNAYGTQVAIIAALRALLPKEDVSHG